MSLRIGELADKIARVKKSDDLPIDIIMRKRDIFLKECG